MFIYLNSFELIFSLLPLQYFSNLFSISSAKVFAFQWKDFILHNFSFNWKVAAAAATNSFNHTMLRGASTSIEMLYQITDTLNHYLFQGAILTGSHQAENLLKMNYTTDFSRYPKASSLSGKGLHHLRLYFKV